MKNFSPLIKKFLEPNCEILQGTREVLARTFQQSKTQNIALSLNGGKDSTVILFLALYFLEQWVYQDESQEQTKVHLHERERTLP